MRLIELLKLLKNLDIKDVERIIEMVMLVMDLFNKEPVVNPIKGAATEDDTELRLEAVINEIKASAANQE